MTAEIAVMNKDAVALAADSAVTISGKKTYNTINKLFSLSRNQPVGIMIYGDGQLGGVPWETIVKLYRDKIGVNQRPKLEDYVSEFISFIEGDFSKHFRDELDDFFIEYVEDYLLVLRDKIDTQVENYIEKKGKIGKRQIGNILRKSIQTDEDYWKKKDKLDFFDDVLLAELIKKYHVEVCELAGDNLEQHNVSAEYLKRITTIVANIFCSKSIEDSGVVFSGFGEDEIFPKLKVCKIECFVLGKLKYISESISVSNEKQKGATIMPFAQTDTVASFLSGISPQLMNNVMNRLHHVFDEYNEVIKMQIKPLKLDDSDVDHIIEELHNNRRKLMNEYFDYIVGAQQHYHINPMIQAIEFLPKNEMAEVAESLVSITSFRQKISLDQETVGGAIDVAVISKTDGFVWIKRKHYFSADINPMFMSKYIKPLEV